jgi:hypothetical protein
VNDQEKLRVLIPHWIEHNAEHAAEFRRWAGRAGSVSAEIHAAAEAILRANAELADALDKLGGPAEEPAQSFTTI